MMPPPSAKSSRSSLTRRTRRRTKISAVTFVQLIFSLASSAIFSVAALLGLSGAVNCFILRPPETIRSVRDRYAVHTNHRRVLVVGRNRNNCKVTHHLASSSEAADGTSIGVQPPKDVPDYVTSPVLQQVYPDLLANIEEYDHPNIPLGTTAGRKCKTLRRLAFQNKLSDMEMDLLTSIGFRFNSLEEVYNEADFDECLARLVEYERINKTGYQIAKKYKEDPELGAWVTMIRRIGRDGMDCERREKLDGIGFAWVSTRKCGSSFMKNYRPIRDLLAEQGEAGAPVVLGNATMYKWLRAQREAYEKGNLSADRVEFLDKLSGLDWMNI